VVPHEGIKLKAGELEEDGVPDFVGRWCGDGPVPSCSRHAYHERVLALRRREACDGAHYLRHPVFGRGGRKDPSTCGVPHLAAGGARTPASCPAGIPPPPPPGGDASGNEDEYAA
jgi:hypothetical protein